MTYFPDLSPYTYLPTSGNAGRSPVNVGWLDRGHGFARGPVPQPFMDALLEHLDMPCNRTRGYHLCNLCDAREPVRVKFHDSEAMLGDAEIHASVPGRLYVAPNLVIHYVAEHDYRPPDLFIAAVLGTERT